uniref:Ovule protein n=1 Tax=Romanomermis culicivorax TaxID=13658 RepID=A0A915KSC0_ROMCU
THSVKDLLNFEPSKLFDLKKQICTKEKCRFGCLMFVLTPCICFNFYHHVFEKLHLDQSHPL